MFALFFDALACDKVCGLYDSLVRFLFALLFSCYDILSEIASFCSRVRIIAFLRSRLFCMLDHYLCVHNWGSRACD